MAGIPISKDIINARVGYLAKTLRDTFSEIERVNSYLADDDNTAALTAMGFSQDELTLVRAAFADLAKLSRVARAQDIQAQPNDYYWNAKHLTGIE